MSHRNDWSGLEQLEDGELERQLLASAALDAPPAGASERAFSQLCSDARGLAALTALPPAPASPSGGWSNPARWRSAEPGPFRAALLGLVFGAAAGAGSVALWLRPAGDPTLLVPPLPPRPALERAAPELLPDPSPQSARAPTPPELAPPRASAPRRAGERGTPPRAASERASRLAREVAALDAARASLAIGAAQSALRQIERYRAEFPAGELAADAEAVAIEALAAEGDHSALAQAAQRFLDRYPRDPHAPRVRELAFIKPPSSTQPAIRQPVPAP
jgi:hypothetical protein